MSTSERDARAARAQSPLHDEHLRRLAPLVSAKLMEVIERRTRLDVSTKGAAYDLVTDADCSMEEWLWDETRRAFPADGFLGEERGWRAGPTGGTDWVVDPIDGTVNLVNGVGWACCSIGALFEGAPAAGLIVDPYRNEIFLTSSPDGGTELNGAPVTVAAGPALAGRLVILEVPSGTSTAALAAIAEVVLAKDGAVRSMGSGALALATVAAGRALAAVHLDPCIWDIAAGVALVEHAGGIVLAGDGPYVAGRPGPLVAGNREVCAQLQAPLRALVR